MTDDRDLRALRREARALLRAAASGDAAASTRVAAVLGSRAEKRFVLADALHVVAREHHALSWPALVAARRRGTIRSELDAALENDGADAVDVETGTNFPDGTPVVVTVRRREHRYMLDDRGATIAKAGRPAGWHQAAEGAVRPSGMNVARTTGALFVPAVEGRDLEDLTARLARAALEVYEAIVALDDPRWMVE